ncbi:hypothetical protein J2S74_000495 [Evansella vedderi]|uniref:Uncharacterized protein n=1 Tax=Evansella vedderi TaxID=38282 RepID=A0ABT9ZPG1_9BACI|nr:hypothetical protein [Evansella vedderi]MDQ0253123.1 hypothetical protein [Evansella vedderi]
MVLRDIDLEKGLVDTGKDGAPYASVQMVLQGDAKRRQAYNRTHKAMLLDRDLHTCTYNHLFLEI